MTMTKSRLRHQWTLLLAAAAMHALPALAAPAEAPTGGGYTLVRQSIAAGGNRASGDNWVLTGTLGQADSGPEPGASGVGFRLHGGFHQESAASPVDAIFQNSFESPLP
jgi:hypothetical protein